jgi:hypothetical protein
VKGALLGGHQVSLLVVREHEHVKGRNGGRSPCSVSLEACQSVFVLKVCPAGGAAQTSANSNCTHPRSGGGGSTGGLARGRGSLPMAPALAGVLFCAWVVQLSLSSTFPSSPYGSVECVWNVIDVIEKFRRRTSEGAFEMIFLSQKPFSYTTVVLR